MIFMVQIPKFQSTSGLFRPPVHAHLHMHVLEREVLWARLNEYAFAHIIIEQQLSFVSLLFAHKAFAKYSVHYSSPGM